MFYKNANDIMFDNLGLFKEEYSKSYTYDKNGNVISAQNLAQQKATFEYSGNNDLLKGINPRGGGYTYEYDYVKKGRLLNAVNNDGNKYSFTYNSYGETTAAKVEEGDKTDTVATTKTYYIKGAGSNKFMEIESSSTVNDARAKQQDLNTEANQQFTFTDVGDRIFQN